FVTYGRFAEERVAVHDRLFFTAAVRNDNSSAFGVQFKNIYYPKFSTSWVMSEEPFFPRIDWLNSLRLRAAWGESGLHPGPLDAIQYYLAQSVTVATAQVLNRPNVGLNVTVTGWGNRNRVLDLGPGISPIIFGLGGFSQRFQARYPAGSYFMVPYTYNDADHNGLLAKSEVTPGTQPVFLGSPFPDHGGTVSTELTIGKHVKLYGLLDGRFGNKLFNTTEQFRCGVLNC